MIKQYASLSEQLLSDKKHKDLLFKDEGFAALRDAYCFLNFLGCRNHIKEKILRKRHRLPIYASFIS